MTGTGTEMGALTLSAGGATGAGAWTGGAGFTGSVCDAGGRAGVAITVAAGVGSTDT